MGELKKAGQGDGGVPLGGTPSGDRGDGADGARNASTRGTDRDADPSGESKNQGHGHPREERGSQRG